MCIDVVDVCIWIAHWQIWLIFDSVTCPRQWLWRGIIGSRFIKKKKKRKKKKIKAMGILLTPPSVRPSVCPSAIFQNHWSEFYQTYYIAYPHSKGVREQHYYSVRPCIRHSSIYQSRCLSLKPLGGFQPILLHHFSSCMLW